VEYYINPSALFPVFHPDSASRKRLVFSEEETEDYFAMLQARTDSLLSIPPPSTAPSMAVSEYSFGRIPIESGVSPSGGRVYRVPIQAASGMKLGPSLSLNYNSQGGEGVAGYGWDVGGMSAITLIGRNVYYHGESRAASRLDNEGSVFALDGVPLVQNDDVATSGEYPLETASGHVLVKTLTGQGGYPSGFMALYPDGRRGTFSRWNAGAQLYPSYPLTELVDRDGNRVSYAYSLDSEEGNDRLEHVFYGSTSGGGYQGAIHFAYDTLSESSVPLRYYAGAAVCHPWRLSGITSMDGADTLCHYSLEYTQKDGVSLLSRIDCLNPDAALPPLTFHYGEMESDPVSGELRRNPDPVLLSSVLTPGSRPLILRRGKFVRNSINDGMLVYESYTTYWKALDLVFYCIYGNLYPADRRIYLAPSLADMNDIDDSIVAGAGFLSAEAVDVDGDGVDEIVKLNGAGVDETGSVLRITIYGCDSTGHPYQKSSYTVSLNGKIGSGSLASPYNRAYHWGDFLGNGKVQLLCIAYASNGMNPNAAQTCYSSLIDLSAGVKLYDSELITVHPGRPRGAFCCDLDGDGRTELCHATDAGMNVYRWQLSGGFSLEQTLSGPSADEMNGDNPTFVTDINGDGYVDIMLSPAVNGGSQWTRYAYTGTRMRQLSMEICSRGEDDEFLFIDLDRDGFTDVVKVNGTSLTSYINSKGRSFSSGTVSPDGISDSKGILPVNVVDYSASSCFAKLDGTGINRYDYTITAGPRRYLTSMTDSYGRYYQNVYSYLPESSLYGVDPAASVDAAAGYRFCTLPLYVLRSEYGRAKENDVSTQFLSRGYQYYSGVGHALGLGFCGFSRVRTYDYTGGNPTVITEEVHAPMKRGAVTLVETRLGSVHAAPHSRINSTYDSHSTQYGKLNPRLTQTTSTDYLTGLTVATAYSYDAYDLPTTVTTTRTSGAGAQKSERLERSYSHSATTQKYILGSVSEESIVREGDGDALLSWKEREVTTFDSLFRPSTRKKYVGGCGYRIVEDGSATEVGEWVEGEDPILDNPVEPGIRPRGGGVQPEPDGPSIPLDSLFIEPVEPEEPAEPEDPEPPLMEEVDATNLVSETRWQYDSYGNVVSEQMAPYGATVFTGKSWTYDGNGRYLTGETDELGHTTTYGSYNKFGKPGTAVDWRGHETALSYDSWGAPVRRENADGSVEETQTLWSSPGEEGLYCIVKRSSNAPETKVYYDALDREVIRGEKRFDGSWLWRKTEYDGKGRVSRVSLPYKGTAPAYWTVNSYDDYGRLLSVVEGASGKQSTWAYDGASVTTVKEGIQSTKTTDANGAVVGVTDGGGTITYILRDDGQPSRVTAPGNVVTSFEYDDYGRRTKMRDPSAGVQTDVYVWNPDGTSVRTHTNANGSVTTRVDRYGRTTGVERAGTDTVAYYYNASGLLERALSTGGVSKRYAYDSLDRVRSVRDSLRDGRWLQQDYSYGPSGRLEQTAYSTQGGPVTTEHYRYANGHQSGIRLQDSTVVWTLVSENGQGRVSEIQTGSISREYGYTPSGLPTFRKMGGGTLQHFAYQFDPLTGNLLSRSDVLRSKTETFAYDTLGRLVGMGARTVTYDSKGNLGQMPDVGQLYYEDADHPYRATAYMPETTSGWPFHDQTVSYTGFNRPLEIQEGAYKATFAYGLADERVKMTLRSGSSVTLTRYYLGGRYEMDETSGGVTKERLYLGGDPYSAPVVYVRENGGAWTLLNIGRDYLGSITHIATGDGTLLAEYSYDPWGRMRNPQTQVLYAGGTEPELLLGRGYTGHEHLKQFGLINMNARLYDPYLGRFLSPDPYVQAPDFSQNFNRYSYALNNPLKYTDESGEVFGVDDVLIALAVGSLFGSYFGGVIANEGQYNPLKWDWSSSQTYKYMLSGAIVGGFSGFVGGAIITSGIPFANTMSTMVSSFLNSLGMNAYSEGLVPISMSYGFASYNFSNNEWGYLWKKGNSWYENMSYMFGAFANIQDVFSFMQGGTEAMAVNSAPINDGGWWGHSSITDLSGESLLSVGPAYGAEKSGGLFETLKNGVQPADMDWSTYFREEGTWSVILPNVSSNAIGKYAASVSQWDFLLNSCVGHTTRALWGAGIPTLYLFHPYMLNAQLFVRKIGIMSSPFLYDWYL
jgi:RHS repeat-associated protein